MSQVAVSSTSRSSNENPDFTGISQTIAGAVVLAADSEEMKENGMSDPDVIPPSQDVYDERKTEIASHVSEDAANEQQPSLLGGLSGRSIFGTSAPASQNPPEHSWQSGGVGGNLFESLSDNKQPDANATPVVSDSLETVTIESGDSVDAPPKESSTASCSEKSPQEVAETASSSSAHETSGAAEDFTLKISQLPESQQSMGQVEDQSQSVLCPSRETLEEEAVDKAESPAGDEASAQLNQEEADQSKEDMEMEEEQSPALAIEDEELAKDYPSDEPDNVSGGNAVGGVKRKRRLTKKERVQLLVEGRRAARERRKLMPKETAAVQKPKEVSPRRRPQKMEPTTPKEEGRRLRERPGPVAPQDSDTSSPPPPTRSNRRRGSGRQAPTPRLEAKVTPPARRVFRHSTPRSASKSAAMQQRKTQSEQKPRKRRAKKAAADPYDIDDVDFDKSPEPLKNIHVAKSFGDIRFSKVPSSENGIKSKYARLEKSAELRRQSTPSSASRFRTSINDTIPVRRIIHKETRHVTPRQRRQLSPNKSSISSGDLADQSSVGTKGSSGPWPQSTPSIGSRDTESSIRMSGGGRKSSSRSRSDKAGSSANGSLSLFSDVEPVNGGRQEEQDSRDSEPTEETPPSSATRRRLTPNTTSRSQRKRRRSPSEERSVKKPNRVYSAPDLDAEKQLEVDCQEEEGTPFLFGARVLAAWKDKNFYPGQVVENEGFGRYKVRFLDGALRDMPQPDIVPLARLKAGDELMVDAAAEGELQPVTLEKCPAATTEEWTDCYYDVYNETKEEKARISWENLVIDVQQKKQFVSTSANFSAENVSPINISGGKERRTRLTKFAEAVGGGRRRTPASPKEPPAGRQKARTSLPKPEHNIEETTSSGEKMDEVVTEEMEYQQIFEGMKFVLTSANRRAKIDFASDSDDERPPIQFIKKNVRQMIEERGGIVIDDFSQVGVGENLFLVADTHYRTHKYLSALARAIPCVSHLWIHNCCTNNKKEDHRNYMLPAGISLEMDHLIDWHDECPKLLKDLKVMVHTENRPQSRTSLDFVQIWAPLVKCMGATLVADLPEEGSLDILLTDASCQMSFLDAAKRLGAFAVSSEWLIQAIITGTRPNPQNHQKYQYDYVESQPSIVSSAPDSSAT